MNTKLRALVVDDSLIFRKIVRDSLASIEGVEVIDVARDGETAIEKIRLLRPDVVTLDVEMPGLDGLQVLEAIQRLKIDTNVIMVSSLTTRGAETTTRALAIGAFDFILKPNHESLEENTRGLQSELERRIEVLRRRHGRASQNRPQVSLKESSSRDARLATNRTAVSTVRANATKVAADPRSVAADQLHLSERLNLSAICIGISTGGPKALNEVIPRLPATIDVPILIVQHMPPLFTKTMAEGLDAHSALTVVEATDGMRLRGGHVYIAPGGRHMRVGGYPGAWTTEITDADPIKSCRPSVDYLFASAADQFRSQVLGIVMTGMGDDGVDGCRAIAAKGGSVWAQDKDSCAVYGMPRQVIDAGLADHVIPLSQIDRWIHRHGCRRTTVAN